MKPCSKMTEVDLWEQQVSSWTDIPSYNFEKIPVVTDNEDLYVQIVSPKSYILTNDHTLAVSKYPVKLLEIKKFYQIRQLSKTKKIRQFCLYEGIFYSGVIKVNSLQSSKKKFPFIFIFDDTCTLKLENLEDIRIQIIRVGRPKINK